MPDSTPSPAAAPLVRAHVPLRVIVVIAALTQAMVILDGTIVNVALPAMKAGLGLSATGQQWVVDGYLVAFGGFLLLAARTGDLIGRKEVFQAGVAVFTLASLAGGLAPDGGLLLAARAVQGLGAAALAPSSLSLITATHADEDQRARALSVWAAAGGVAGSLGIVLGGVLVSELSWRWVLFVNVPVGVGLFLAGLSSLRASDRTAGWGRLDVPGAVTATAGTGALVLGISQATSDGWGSAGALGALAAAAVLLGLFLLAETRSPDPLVPLGIFRHHSLSAANAIMACLGVVLTAETFFLSLYQQQVLGYSALRTGLALLPLGVALATGAVLSERLVPVLGPRALLTVGALIAAAGFAWQATLPARSSYSAHVLGPTLILGAGLGLMMVPVTEAATAGIAPQLAGLASGLVNAARQIGGAVGLAVLVTIAVSAARHPGAAAPAAATVRGYNMALAACAGVSLLAALLALLVPARTQPAPPRPDGPAPHARSHRMSPAADQESAQ